MKSFLLGLYNFVMRLTMLIPFNCIRILILKASGAHIGKHCFIGSKCEIRKPTNLTICNNTIINPDCLIDCRGGVLQIGKNVDIAQETIIWTETHDPHDDYHRTVDRPVIIEDYCWIGSRVMIMPGVKISKGAVIAAGAIVTRNVDSKSIVAGIPAKKIGIRKSNLEYKLDYSPYFK